MPRSDWSELKNFCDDIGLAFFATVFNQSDIDFVAEIGVSSLKIASQDLNFRQLIEAAAHTNLPVQIDTGGGSLSEVEQAVDWITECGNEQIIINQCPSGYPARIESIHLKMITTLRLLYPFPIAFSITIQDLHGRCSGVTCTRNRENNHAR